MSFDLHGDFKNYRTLFDLPLCRVLLSPQSLFPWLILVPRKEGLSELLDLSSKDQHQLMDEIQKISCLVKEVWHPDKLNIAAIGNITPQLHIHVIARFKSDPCWPGVVWGYELVPYQKEIEDKIVQNLRIELEKIR